MRKKAEREIEIVRTEHPFEMYCDKKFTMTAIPENRKQMFAFYSNQCGEPR